MSFGEVHFSPTAESFGVSAQIGSGVVRGGPEVRFHQGSTRVPPGFHEFHKVLRGLRGGASIKKSTACCWGCHLSLFLFILFLRLALSIPTTAKEAGGLLGIQESSVLIVLLIISLLNIIVFPGGAGAFVELKMAFVQVILLSIPLLIRFLFILKWTGDCWGNSKFMFALIIVCLIIALSIRSTPKGTGAVWGIQKSCALL